MYFFWDCRARVRVRQHHNSPTRVWRISEFMSTESLNGTLILNLKSPTAAELSTSLKILYLWALHHISSKSSMSPMLFQYSSMALKSIACPLQTSGLSRISKKSAWDGFTGILGIIWTLFSHIKSYRWPFESNLRTADCSFSWLKRSYWATSVIMLVFSLGVTRRRKNKFKLKRKVAPGSFYARFINMINFLYRHGIIDDDNFKINKTVEHFESIIPFFNPCSLCSWFVCCNCPLVPAL